MAGEVAVISPRILDDTIDGPNQDQEARRVEHINLGWPQPLTKSSN